MFSVNDEKMRWAMHQMAIYASIYPDHCVVILVDTVEDMNSVVKYVDLAVGDGAPISNPRRTKIVAGSDGLIVVQTARDMTFKDAVIADVVLNFSFGDMSEAAVDSMLEADFVINFGVR